MMSTRNFIRSIDATIESMARPFAKAMALAADYREARQAEAEGAERSVAAIPFNRADFDRRINAANVLLQSCSKLAEACADAKPAYFAGLARLERHVAKVAAKATGEQKRQLDELQMRVEEFGAMIEEFAL